MKIRASAILSALCTVSSEFMHSSILFIGVVTHCVTMISDKTRVKLSLWKVQIVIYRKIGTFHKSKKST